MKDTQAVQDIAQEQREHLIDSGIVRSIRGQYIDVLLDGTKKLVREVILSKSITTIKEGWWVIVVRIPRSNRWIAMVALESITTGSSAVSSDLTVPADVTATAKPYLIELSWSGSFRDVATYEVQHNSSASETGATTVKIEGSNFLYWCAPGTQRYFRVRAVSSSYERSAWSSWVNDTATSGDAYMFLGVDSAGTAPEWTALDWDNVAGVAGADMEHNHHSAAEGGTELWPDRLGVGTTSIPAMDGVIGVPEAGGTPPYAPNEGRYYAKDVSGITEAFYEDDQGREIQLTDDGSVNAAGAGGAPTDAEYLVLTLDGILIGERRFVDGDGLTCFRQTWTKLDRYGFAYTKSVSI